VGPRPLRKLGWPHLPAKDILLLQVPIPLQILCDCSWCRLP
jgi:hypothetical protein